MKIVYSILLAILTFLAVSSGITKIALMQQDVVFFSKFGFSNSMLIAFGVVQLIGGIMLPFKKTRFAGATIIAATFLASLVLLLLDGNIAVSIITVVATLLLFVVMKLSWQSRASGVDP